MTDRHTSSADELVVVVAGGNPLPPKSAEAVGAAVVVAADSGIDRALEAGLRVDHAVGDFDSVSTAGLAEAVATGAEIHRHPAAKDATDLELALDVACSLAARRLLVLGGDGGRLDHFWANLELLAAPAYAHAEVQARMDRALVTIVRSGPSRAACLTGSTGSLVSLLAVHGTARGVTTEGLLYPLAAEDLGAGSTRGVSNQFTSVAARVSQAEGVLAVIQPELEERRS